MVGIASDMLLLLTSPASDMLVVVLLVAAMVGIKETNLLTPSLIVTELEMDMNELETVQGRLLLLLLLLLSIRGILFVQHGRRLTWLFALLVAYGRPEASKQTNTS